MGSDHGRNTSSLAESSAGSSRRRCRRRSSATRRRARGRAPRVLGRALRARWTGLHVPRRTAARATARSSSRRARGARRGCVPGSVSCRPCSRPPSSPRPRAGAAPRRCCAASTTGAKVATIAVSGALDGEPVAGRLSDGVLEPVVSASVARRRPVPVRNATTGAQTWCASSSRRRLATPASGHRARQRRSHAGAGRIEVDGTVVAIDDALAAVATSASATSRAVLFAAESDRRRRSGASTPRASTRRPGQFRAPDRPFQGVEAPLRDMLSRTEARAPAVWTRLASSTIATTVGRSLVRGRRRRSHSTPRSRTPRTACRRSAASASPGSTTRTSTPARP